MTHNRRRPIALTLLAALGLASQSFAHPDHGEEDTAAPGASAIKDSVLTGSGSYTFRSMPDWCQTPTGQETLGPTHGAIVVDRSGKIYCSLDSGDFGILVYRPDGSILRAVAKGLSGIHAMCLREEDDQEYIYAAHLKGKQIVKLKLDGSVVWSIEGPPMESGKYKDADQYKPTAVAVSPEGDIYVADGYGTSWIHQYNSDRTYRRSFGGRGDALAEFHTCHGLAIDTRGDTPLLLVCDREHRRLVHFSLDGTMKAVIAEDLRRPCSVAFFGDTLAVAELEGRVTLFDGSNQIVTHLGDNADPSDWANYRVPVTQWQEGVFTAPHGLAFDADGNLLVMDWNAWGRITRLNRVGQ